MRDSMILPLFRASSNAQAADVTTSYLADYAKVTSFLVRVSCPADPFRSQFYYKSNDVDGYEKPSNMQEAITLVDLFDIKMNRRDIAKPKEGIAPLVPPSEPTGPAPPWVATWLNHPPSSNEANSDRLPVPPCATQ